MKELKNNIIKKDEVSCVILAGGEGKRLDGRGKYSQLFKQKTLLEHVYSRMIIQTSNLAVNFRNYDYKVNHKYNIVIDKFNEDIGPLAGIHAAISYSKESFSSVVTVPVDTPFIPFDLITKLNKSFNPLYTEVAIACSGNRHHPTIAMWNTSIIKKLEESIENNVRKIDNFTQDLKKCYVKWDLVKYDPFYNINTYSDLKKAENMIKDIK
ncbi:molybdenum cofactor guanylyltransferase [Alphaproteobacteria bacterium]|nr:molybdenum cofactor guanylyltransferase [Alphaproteobacteria bacterium]